jgi:DNA polymerase elongation subunit (family B)
MSEFYTYTKQFGNEVLYRGYKDGRSILSRVPYQPTLYKRCNFETGWHDFHGGHVDPIKFDSIRDAKAYAEKYKDVSNFEIFGNLKFNYQLIKDFFPGKISHTFGDIKLLSCDIETSVSMGFPNVLDPQEEITHLTVIDRHKETPVCFTTYDVDVSDMDVDYRLFTTEAEMLTSFVNYIADEKPDILTGYYCEKFDYPYIFARIEKILGEDYCKKMSPFGKYRWKDFKYDNGDIERTVEIFGISILDYIELYKKFANTKHEEWGLGFVASYELGQTKLENPFETFSEFSTGEGMIYKDPGEGATELERLAYRKHLLSDQMSAGDTSVSDELEDISRQVKTLSKTLFTKYNIIDTMLVHRMDQKLKLIDLAMVMTFDYKCNPSDVLATVTPWDCKIHGWLLDRKIVIPNPPRKEMDKAIEGAYVKEPLSGRYEWEVSVDAESLYPCIMMSWNISPDTILPYMRDSSVDFLLSRKLKTDDLLTKNYALAVNGAMFTKEKRGFIPAIIEMLFNERKAIKREMLDLEAKINAIKAADPNADVSAMGDLKDSLDNQQKARKLSANSCYGYFGNKHARYFDIRIAEAITITGQSVTKTCEIATNVQMNKLMGTKEKDYVIMSHTDSLFINMGDIVKKHFSHIKDDDKLCDIIDKIVKEKITPAINEACKDITTYTNSYENRLNLKREKIGRYGIHMPAKNRYAVLVLDNEGVRYAKPKLAVVGLEIVRSSTPGIVKTPLKKALEIAMKGTEEEMQQFIKDEKDKFLTQDVETISFPRAVNGISKWTSFDGTTDFKKACPIHVGAVIKYNKELERRNLSLKHPKINEGDKIKFVYLREPNTLRHHVIAFKGKLPKEFGLHDYVDYETSWDKVFMGPLRPVLGVVGWKEEKIYDLNGLFD